MKNSMKFRGKAEKIFNKLDKLDEYDDKIEFLESHMQDLSVEISSEKNQGESIIILIDGDGNLKIRSKDGKRKSPRITQHAIKVLYDFIRENYEVD